MDERDNRTLTDAVHHQKGRGDPFGAAVRSNRMPMIITNAEVRDNRIIFANDAFQQLNGYDRPELMGRNCRLLQGPEPDLATIARIRAAVAAGTDISIDVQEPQGRHDFLERAL